MGSTRFASAIRAESPSAGRPEMLLEELLKPLEVS
jgi:hypothetical protein